MTDKTCNHLVFTTFTHCLALLLAVAATATLFAQPAPISLDSRQDAESVRALAIPRSGRHVIAASDRRPGVELRIWNRDDGSEKVLSPEEYNRHSLPRVHKGDLQLLRVSDDGHKLGCLVVANRTLRLDLYDLERGSMLSKCTIPFSFRGCRFSPNLDVLYAWDYVYDGRERPPVARVMLTATGDVVHEFSPHVNNREELRRNNPRSDERYRGVLSDLTVSPSGRYFATIGSNRTSLSMLRVWDASSFQLISQTDVSGENHFLAGFAFWLTDSSLVMVGEEGRKWWLQHWQLFGAQDARKKHAWRMDSLAYFHNASAVASPDGEYLAITDESMLHIFHTTSGRLAHKTGHTHRWQFDPWSFSPNRHELWFVDRDTPGITSISFPDVSAPFQLRR